MKSNYFQNVKKEIKNISLKNKILKQNRYLDISDGDVQARHNQILNQINLFENKIISTFYNLVYFYIKYDGKREATECISKYPQRISNYVVNCIHLELEDLYKENNLDMRFAVWWRHNLYTSTVYFKPQIPIKLLRFIEKNITESKKELMEFYNSFCDWIVKSELSKSFLNNNQRLLIRGL